MSPAADSRHRFETIAGEVFDPLQRYLRRRLDPAEAEDVFAEVLATVWRRINDVPADRVLPWCYGIARRQVANHRRGKRRHLRLIERLQTEPQKTIEPDPAEAGPDPELTIALGGLSDADREIIRLWAWEQLEPREIAPVLGVSVNAATIRLGRARRRLADEMARQNRDSAGHETGKGTTE